MAKQLSFIPKKKGSTLGTVYVIDKGQAVYSDVFDIAKSSKQKACVKAIRKEFPDDAGLTAETITSWMLKEAMYNDNEQIVDKEFGPEIDVTSIVRPHLFFTPEVTGLLTPVASLCNGSFTKRWCQALQWSDGKREIRELNYNHIEITNDKNIWFDPMPQTPTVKGGWSKESRDKWLAGYTPNPTEIFNRLKTLFNYFLDFPEDETEGNLTTLSLWTMLSYVYEAFSAVPYMSIGGPIGSGKTKIFEILKEIISNPIPSSNMSAPCLFRMLHDQGGILLLDEAERLRSGKADSEEIMSILLAGYKKGGKAHRLKPNADGSYTPIDFNVYSPKAIAAVRELPAALVSRCIKMVMFRADKSSQKPYHIIKHRTKEYESLSNELHTFALCYGKQLLELAENTSLCKKMLGRNIEVWQPIFALASLIEEDGLLTTLREHADKSIKLTEVDSIPEADEIVIMELAKNKEGITAKGLLDKVKGENESMFYHYSSRGIGAILKRYHIHPLRKRQGRDYAEKLFKLSDEQYEKIRDNYGIDAGVPDVKDILREGREATNPKSIVSPRLPSKDYPKGNGKEKTMPTKLEAKGEKKVKPLSVVPDVTGGNGVSISDTSDIQIHPISDKLREIQKEGKLLEIHN